MPGTRSKMIGAMRLLHHYRFEDAVNLTTSALGRPLYGKRPSWERARRGAFEAIFGTLLYEWDDPSEEDLLKDELCSYSKLEGGRRGRPPSKKNGKKLVTT